MKKALYFLQIAVLTIYLHGSVRASDYIRQYNYSTGITYHVYLNDLEGEVWSPEIVPSPGAHFELWAHGISNDCRMYRLDAKIVGTYLPQATVSIESQDPHPELRTRADIPYTVEVVVSGLVGDEMAPLAARVTSFVRRGENFPEKLYRIPLNADREPYVLESYDMSNGLVRSTHYNGISPAAPTEASGAETYTVYSYPDDIIPEASILDTKTINIWPVTKATISGVEAGARYLHTLPNLYINLDSLYPTSLTYAQIYEGDAVLGTIGTILPATVRELNAPVPQDEQMVLDDWDDFIDEDGTYTIEVLTQTVYNEGNPERLAHITFEVDREVEMRAAITTSE